jgi:hypothetical protein
VYLTDAYALYFAIQPLESIRTEEGVVLEVDTELLDQDLLRPDEDYVAQVLRQHNTDMTLQDVQLYAQAYLDDFAELWADSIERLGTMAYKGAVPLSAITRVARIDFSRLPHIASMALDPQISLINYALCGGKYRALTRWVFGEPMDTDEFSGWQLFGEEIRDEIRATFESRIGITVRPCVDTDDLQPPGGRPGPVVRPAGADASE